MKVDLVKKELKDFQEIINAKENNIYVAELVNELMTTETKYFDNDINMKTTLIDLISQYDEDYSLLKESINLTKLNYDEYINNPYTKNIKLNNIKYKNYMIKNDKYLPYELFISNDIEITNTTSFKEITNLGYFTKEFPYISLYKDNTIWMLITPNEINTMKESINEVNGTVITFGLGLGYFQYMISLKENVKKIYVIEKDKEIINLFKKYILPQFKYKDKIEIIEMDANKFISEEYSKYNANYYFIDLYHNPIDGLKFFINFKKLEKNIPNTKVLYWLNKSLLSYVRRCLISLLIEQYEELDPSNYLKAKTDSDKLINLIYENTLNISILTIIDLRNFLKDESINKLLKSLK